jgi:hypothetical protein
VTSIDRNGIRVSSVPGSVGAPTFLLTLIHRSAWNRSSPKFACRIVHKTSSENP